MSQHVLDFSKYENKKRYSRRGAKAYHEEQARLEGLFRQDLCAAHGMDPVDPLTGRMYAYAWSQGHSAGYEEVSFYFAELVEVFRGGER